MTEDDFPKYIPDRAFSGFAFKKERFGLYVNHNPEVPDGEIWVPEHVGPQEVRFIGRTQRKRKKKGPMSITFLAYPFGTCVEKLTLIRHYPSVNMVPMDCGSTFAVNDPFLEELVRVYQKKDCFDEIGMRIDTPPADHNYLQTHLGYVPGPPVFCPIHHPMKDITGVGLTDLLDDQSRDR